MALDEGHQTLIDRVIATAEKQQMFEKVRQARIGWRLVMTAGGHTQAHPNLLRPKLLLRSQLGAIGQSPGNGSLIRHRWFSGQLAAKRAPLHHGPAMLLLA
jgi:hypothetical protein